MKCKVGDLVLDQKLLELRPINIYFVSRYRQALRNGAHFPPPLIEKDTLRVVSGNHRVTMYLEEYGPDYMIEVIPEVFPDEAAVIRRFAEENSKHGMPLSGISQKSITQLLLKYGDSAETISQVLNIPVKKVELLAGISVVVIGPNRKKENKPVKHGLEHMIGKTVDRKQYEQHKKVDRGLPVSSLASQIIRWIENDWIDQENSDTMKVLSDLSATLNSFLSSKKKKKSM